MAAPYEDASLMKYGCAVFDAAGWNPHSGKASSLQLQSFFIFLFAE
jgi:hypothetical protein